MGRIWEARGELLLADFAGMRGELLSMSAEDYRQSPSASRSLEAGLGQLRDHANELATRDARDLVERFGQLGRRKLQLAG